MKKTFSILDLFFMGLFSFVFIGLFASEPAMNNYKLLTSHYPFAVGFAKFALLATFGESLAQRIGSGTYNPKDYGLLPKAILWGILGIIITAAFIIFSNGAPFILNKLGFLWGTTALNSPFGIEKIITAFTVSLTMNILFAPFLMLSHSLADAFVAENNGSIKCFMHKPNIVKYLQRINWEQFWKFVIVRNILFFWIPMHTITFLLPETFRVLFAAVLGACLGLILTSIKIKSQTSISL